MLRIIARSLRNRRHMIHAFERLSHRMRDGLRRGPNRAGFSCPYTVLIFVCVGFLFYRYNGGGNFTKMSVINNTRRYIAVRLPKCHIVMSFGGVAVQLPLRNVSNKWR
jgi:hypothetical protein